MGLARQDAMNLPPALCSRSARIAAACLPLAPAAIAGQLPHDLPPSLVLIDAGVQHDLGAGIDGEGDVALTRTRATIGFHRKLDDDWVLRGQVGGEHAHYDWSSDALFLGTSDPWSEIWKVGAGLQVIRRLDEAWIGHVSATAVSAAEPGAEIDDSLDYRLRVGAAWRQDENLTLGLDVTASTHLEDSTLVLPFPVVDWRFAPEWRLVSDIGDVIVGPSVGVHRTFSEGFDLGLVATGVYNDARLDDGRVPDGVLRETRIAAGLEATWRPRPGIEVSLLAGYDVWGEMQVDDADGDEVERTDLDPAPLFGLSVQVAF
jgi:hypothetical protein